MPENILDNQDYDLRESLREDFDNLTENIQAILDIGAEALAEAEEKTEIVAQVDPDSFEYEQLVEEIKEAQARAGHAFEQAEKFIAAANDLLNS